MAVSGIIKPLVQYSKEELLAEVVNLRAEVRVLKAKVREETRVGVPND